MSAPSQAVSEANARAAGYLNHPIPKLHIGGQIIAPLADYERAYPMWRTLRDCYAGEIQVKSKGEQYLRRPSNVKSKDYEGFLARAYFYNATRRTHKGLLGSMMRKNPEVTLPTNLRTDLNSISIDGQSFVEFTRQICHELLLVGRFGILADIPENTPLGTQPSPYLSGYKAEAIFRPRWTLIDGRRVLDRLILREERVTNTEYSQTIEQIYRILRLDYVTDSATGQSSWVYSQDIITPASPHITASVETISHREVRVQGRTLNRIPFTFVNSTNTLQAIEDPVLFDIATLNLSHYGSTALLEHGRFYAGMPTYYIAGQGAGSTGLDEIAEDLSQAEPMSVGPSNVWMLEQGDKCGLLEFNGHGLTFLENAVDSKQLQMQSLGGKFIPAQQKSAALSTEAYGLMEAGDEATLLDIALTVDKALATALNHMSDLQNNAPSTTCKVELNKEFVRSEMTAREISALRTLYESRMIPLDVMYYSLRQIGVVPMEYTLQDFKTLLEQPSQLYADPSVQPIPGGPTYNPADIKDPRNAPAPKLPANNGIEDE